MLTRHLFNKHHWSIFITSILLCIFFDRALHAQANNDENKNRRARLSLETFARQNKGDRSWGRPPSRTSGGSRSSCSEQLVALVPGENKVSNQGCQGESQSFVTATVSANPTVWIYVPSTLTEQPAELVILDSQQRPLSIKSIALPQTEGIIGLRLDRPLKTNQGYRWQLSALLHPQSPSQNPTVEGLITRVAAESDLTKQVATVKSQLETAHSYAEAGIWQDTVTSFANLHCNNPQNNAIESDWHELLNMAGLKAIAPFPIVNCKNHDL